MLVSIGFRFLTTLILLSGMLPQTALSQPLVESRRNSLRIQAGMFWPIGEWSRHRYARGIDQFRRGPIFGLELEHRISSVLGIGGMSAFGLLDMSAWEDFARSQGDNIEASAHLFYLGVNVKIYLVSDTENNLKLALGLLYFASDGQERFNGLDYDYDFISVRSVGSLIGMEYERFIGENISISLKVDLLIVLSGIRYADGRTYSVYALPTTLGAQFYF